MQYLKQKWLINACLLFYFLGKGKWPEDLLLQELVDAVGVSTVQCLGGGLKVDLSIRVVVVHQ